jgi:hypothetical protein
MNKQKVLKVVNILMAIDLIALVTTAMLDETLPPEVFARVHPLLGLILVTFVIIHLILNFSWIKSSYFAHKK